MEIKIGSAKIKAMQQNESKNIIATKREQPPAGKGSSNSKGDFSQGKVSLAIIKLALPLCLAQLVNVLYNIVDRVYIGHIEGVGAAALTGVGVTFPIISIISGFINMCGLGGAPAFSMARGAGDDKKAGEIMGTSLSLLIICGAVLMAAVLIFKKPLLYAFGASDATFSYGDDYITIYIMGIFFSMISIGLNPYINNQGFGGTGMLTTVIGAAINIVLDPFFIFDSFSVVGLHINGLNLGTKGAALATIFSQFVSAVWVLIFLTKKAPLRLRLQNMRLKWANVKTILSVGLVQLIWSFTTSASQILYNASLQSYGGDIYVGIMTVINSIREMLLMGIHGLTGGAQPVISYNYGAGDCKRTLDGIKFLTLAGLIYTTVVSGTILLFPGAMIGIFTDSKELLSKGPEMVRIFFSLQAVMAFHIVGQYTFTALGKSGKAIFFSIFRKIILVVSLVIALPRIFSAFPVKAIYMSEPIADVIAGIVCFSAMYITVWRKLSRGQLPKK